MSRIFPQAVIGRMRRFPKEDGNYHTDNNGKCYLVRDQTAIRFGDSDRVICSVIMTNPGSFGFDQIAGWASFVSGAGNEDRFEHDSGRPDPTMRNLIAVLQRSASVNKNIVLDGRVNIYNLSNVVCPKGELAEAYHHQIKALVGEVPAACELLEDPWIHTDWLNVLFHSSPFVLIGFLQDKFLPAVHKVMAVAAQHPTKALWAWNNNWPQHPINWIRRPALGAQIVEQIASFG